MFKYDHLELARIIGEPRDPRRPYPLLVNQLCEVDSADPNEYVYYYDVLQDTDVVYTITSTGAVTQSNVTPDTPVLLNFVDYASPEYYVKITDLASSKEQVLARKKATIERALNAQENNAIVSLLASASASTGNLNDLRSGEKAFNYQHLIDMIDQVIDYSENYVLVAGTQIDKDIKLWNWTDNKYANLLEAFNDLGISVQRINQTVSLDSVNTNVLASTVAYLVGTQTEQPGKPLLFVRKRMNEIEKLGGIISESGTQAERLVFISPNPVQVSSTRYLAVGMTGFEEIVVAVTNPKAIAKFTRTV
jgi:hypothetical protein